MFHLFGLTLNGYCGVSPMTFARETIGQVRARDRQVAGTFRNGARPSGAVAMPDGKKLSDQAYNNLQRSLDEFRAGGRSEERRVGKEAVSACRSRGSPYH